MMRSSLFRRSPLLALALLLGALLLFRAAPAEASHTLATPTNLQAQARDGEVMLTWETGGGNHADYHVEYRENQSSNRLGLRSVTGRTSTIRNLTNGTTYQFRVRAKAHSGHRASAWTDYVTATPVASSDAVWSATLTVDQSGVSFGCDNGDASQDNCSSSTVLTEDTFSHGGSTYTVNEVRWQSDINRLYFGFSGVTGQAIKTALSSLTLTVGVIPLAFSDATVDSGSIYWAYDPPTDWLNGEAVKLSLRTAAQQSTIPTQPPPSTGPSVPSGLSVNPGDAVLELTWNQSSGATGYDVHYTSAPSTGNGAVSNTAAASGSNPATGWVAVSRSGTTASQTITGLTNGTTYRVRVRATNSDGSSGWGIVSGTPTILLKWPSSSVDRTEGGGNDPIQLSDSSGFTQTISAGVTYTPGISNSASLTDDLQTGYATTITSMPNALVNFTLATPDNDTVNEAHETYTVTINAGTGYTVGTPATLTVRIIDNDAPAAPAGLSLSGENQKLTASWTKPAGPVTGYQLRYKETSAADQTATTAGDPSTGWVTSTPSGTVTSAEFTGLTNFTEYQVQVRATDGQTQTGNGYGDWSASQTGTPAVNADLSGLTVRVADSASGTFWVTPLNPSTFAAGTTNYTTSVAHSRTHTKITPTVRDPNATVEVGKGSSLAAVTSGSASDAIPLSVGANVITVKVTAVGGATTKTYTVTVTRLESTAPPVPADLLVSNTGQRYGTGTDFDNNVHGQAFTTGPSMDGYQLTGIEALLYTGAAFTSEDAATVRAELWSDSNGTPGTRFVYMTARNIPTGTTGSHTVTFTPSYGVPTTLAANTTYHFVIYTTGSLSSNTLELDLTRSTDEDVGTAEGWNIADHHSILGSQNTPPWTPTWITANGIVQIAVKGQPVSITHWTSTLAVKDLGHLSGDGCIGQQQCSAQLSPGNSFVYGPWPYSVLAVRVVRGSLQLLLDRAPPPHPDQLRLDVGGKQFQFKDAMESWGIDRNEDAWRLTWHGTDLDWSDGDAVSVSLVGRNVPAPATPAPHTDLNPVRVHYDGMVNGEPVDNFNNLSLARPKPSTIPGTFERRVELRAYVPGTFPSADPAQGMVTTTHVMLRVTAHPDSTLEWAIGNVYGVTGSFAAFPNGGFTPAIALNPASKWTYVYIKVTNGSQSATHLVAIDPPPRTYTLSPDVSVTEGEEAALSLSLGSPAGAGGVSFTVSADYPDGGATAEDVGQFPATLTVPEGQQSARIIIPTVDDEAVEEDEERFTVRVAHTGEPAWAVDPEGTAAAVVTIVDNDEPPAAPEGPEPWDIRVVPGDGTLTVTWNVGSRDGVEDSEIWHVLRWSQEPGVWANPRDPRAVGKSDGLSVDPGLTSYTITDLKNGVATGVFIRSMVGHRNNMSEREENSSEWVRTKGEHTTPVAPPNDAPTVSAGIADATIVNESGTHEASLAGVFDDADGDALTVTASSSDENVATVSVSADYSTLTVTPQSRGTATITVNASDGKGGEASDTFAVTVKAAPVTASPIAEISGLEAGDSRTISMSGVFSDADADPVTVTQASSSDRAIVAVSAALDGATTAITAVTVTARSEGTATITVTAKDSDGNTVSDAFEVTVNAPAPEQQQKAVELPGPVANLQLEVTEGGVIVSWSAPGSGDALRGYIVHLKPEDGGKGKTKTPKAKKTKVRFDNLEAGRTYRVWVRAQNEAGKGERVRASITLPEAEPPPDQGEQQDSQSGQ